MSMAAEIETFKIGLDGEWSLEDLYLFPRTYEQVYFLVYSLSDELDEYQLDRIKWAYEAFPWQGGYSAVNFYNQLKFATPKNERPWVFSIEYSSPGTLELGLLITIALNVRQIVKIVSETIKIANKTYSDVVREMQKRKLMRLKTKRAELAFRKSEIRFIEESAKKMAKALGISNFEELNARTGNSYRTLKILLSLYRRVRTLAEYQNRKKADFLVPQNQKRVSKKRSRAHRVKRTR
jgi:hypothetical protein